ncbi:acyl carrier protein [Paraburkholderia unamae]|uniref:Acyl carrier protein n=1 Tax=Paraburkholderia unamae TaxID=219649 RepID=A0ABX5KAQ0_9BURK|nr:acyl carrier protein [Paraburkholderia unamae]PVX61272.1 acyl carrier protein [Paraburkholderia unamae]
MIEVKSNVAEKIREILATQYCTTVDELRDDTRLVEELGGDSLDRIELVMAVEDEYDIEIPDEDLDKFTTVQSIIEYVQSKV